MLENLFKTLQSPKSMYFLSSSILWGFDPMKGGKNLLPVHLTLILKVLPSLYKLPNKVLGERTLCG